MEKIIENLSCMFESFKIDADKAAKGNKAAGMRARKLSLGIEKELKNFRKESLK